MADLLFSCHGWSRLPAVWPWQIKVYIVRFIPGIWISQKILGSQNPGLKKSQKSSNLVQKSGEVNYWWSCPDKSRFTKSDLFLESGYSRKSWENKILGYILGRLFSCHGWSRLPEIWPWQIKVYILYAHHYNPLLIWNRSWIPTIHKARILRKKPLKKTFLDFKKWVKSIQTAGYNGARMMRYNDFHWYWCRAMCKKYFRR